MDRKNSLILIYKHSLKVVHSFLMYQLISERKSFLERMYILKLIIMTFLEILTPIKLKLKFLDQFHPSLLEMTIHQKW